MGGVHHVRVRGSRSLMLSTKLAVAKVLGSVAVGRTVGWASRDRIRSRGVIVSTRSPLVPPQVKGLLRSGLYESAEARMVGAHLRTDLPVVELGASIGFVTALIGRRRPPRIVAVEANPALIQSICETLAMNGVTGVDVVHTAIAYDFAGSNAGRRRARLQVSDFNLGSSILVGRSVDHDSHDVDVPATSLGQLLRDHDIERYTCVCDIEGAELAMITNEVAPIVDGCQQLIIELHERQITGEVVRIPVLVDAIATRWGLTPVAHDGNVWRFERISTAS